MSISLDFLFTAHTDTMFLHAYKACSVRHPDVKKAIFHSDYNPITLC